jgi:HSP20 family protein
MKMDQYNIPPVDIFETKDKYILELDMPGSSRECIDVSYTDDELIVTGKVRDSVREWIPVAAEFGIHDYRKEFTIGSDIKREAIEAKYEDGILTIELEKSEAAKKRKIEVKAA